MKSIHHGNRDETTFVLVCGFCSLEHAVQIKKLFAVRWNVGEKSCVCCCCFSAFVMYGRIQGIIIICFNETIHDIKIKSTFLQRNSLKNSSHRRLSYTRKKNQLWNWRNLAFHEMVNSVFFSLSLSRWILSVVRGEKCLIICVPNAIVHKTAIAISVILYCLVGKSLSIHPHWYIAFYLLPTLALCVCNLPYSAYGFLFISV